VKALPLQLQLQMQIALRGADVLKLAGVSDADKERDCKRGQARLLSYRNKR